MDCNRLLYIVYILFGRYTCCVKFERSARERDNGGLNVRIYIKTRRDAERRGAARHGTLDGTAKRTHPSSRVRGIRTINRSA